MSEYSTHAIRSFIDTHAPPDTRIAKHSVTALQTALEAYIRESAGYAWERAADADRKTIYNRDFDVEQPPPKDTLVLPVAPLKRVLHDELPDTARVGENAVLALAGIVEEYGETIVTHAYLFADHADRNTLFAADINLYFDLFEDLPQ